LLISKSSHLVILQNVFKKQLFKRIKKNGYCHGNGNGNGHSNGNGYYNGNAKAPTPVALVLQR
jgi:hypothetical protein